MSLIPFSIHMQFLHRQLSKSSGASLSSSDQDPQTKFYKRALTTTSKSNLPSRKYMVFFTGSIWLVNRAVKQARTGK